MPEQKIIKKAIILAGGLNSRMMPMSKVIPKALLPLGFKPAIHYLVEECLASGIKEIIIVVSERNSLIKKYFSKDKKLERLFLKYEKKEALSELHKILKLKKFLRFVTQERPLGEADALKCAMRNIKKGEDVAVLFGDTLYDSKVPAILQVIRAKRNNFKLILADSRFVITSQGLKTIASFDFSTKENFNKRIIDVFAEKDQSSIIPLEGVKFRIGTLETFNKTIKSWDGIMDGQIQKT